MDIKCPWCGHPIPIDNYNEHIEKMHSSIIPAGERNRPKVATSPDIARTKLPENVSATSEEKRYHVKYMEKGTYRPKEDNFTRKEIIKFYQEKPYEQIIEVTTIMSEEEANRHLNRAREAD